MSKLNDSVYMVGYLLDDIKDPSVILPSNKVILQIFFYHHKTLNQSIHKSASATYNKILPFWQKLNIPTQSKKYVISKIEDLFLKHKKLKKNANRTNASNFNSQVDRENEFLETIDQLFDIAQNKKIEQQYDKNSQVVKVLEALRSGSKILRSAVNSLQEVSIFYVSLFPKKN